VPIKKNGVCGDASSDVIGASMMSVWVHTLGELKLNLGRFCLECLLELIFFCVNRNPAIKFWREISTFNFFMNYIVSR
jgi:hypothetical protein